VSQPRHKAQRTRLTAQLARVALLAAVVVACAALLDAQGRGGQQGGRRGGAGPGGQEISLNGGQPPIPCTNHWQRPDGCTKKTGTYNARDFSGGVWMRIRGAANMTPAADAFLTAEGRKKFESYKPSFGPRGVPPALGNDPIGNCDPMGLTRNLFTEIAARTFDFAHEPDRIMQFFEYAHQYRTIWLDGRKLPKEPEPRWMGYSTGRWDGDTLVVESNGMDERNWADHLGHPLSDQAHLEERYRRPNWDTLELTITITDPVYYSKPWVSDTKIHRIQTERAMDDRMEMFCVPSEEQEFNRLIRDPAAGIKR
jgi:hypothetical protein